MAGWYEVIKTIKGRPYRYRQRTWREGKQVRTQSYSLGPASPADISRIKTEAAQRKSGPSRARVRSIFKLLTNPANATTWTNPWSFDEAVNTTFSRTPVVRNMLERHKITVFETPEAAGYHRDKDVLLLPPPSHFHSLDGYSATVMHEIAHWTGAAGRLGRTFGRLGPGATDEDRQNYAREEVVAEATAWIVLAELGLRPGPDEVGANALYLQTWLNRTADPAATLAYAEIEAQRAARFILSVNTTL